jgi:hypothetical protein
LEVSVGNSKIDEIVQNGTGVFKAEKKGKNWICDLDEADVDKILKINKDAVKDGEEIILFVESFGMLEAKDIVLKAIETLGSNLDEFEKQVK